MLVQERFRLPDGFKQELRQRTPKWGFGLLSEATFLRTYSRWIDSEERMESWADVVIRVVEGVFSIRKDHMRRLLGREWDDYDYQNYATMMAHYMFEFRFLPPGRGLFIGGTDYVFERGNHAHNNCGFVSVQESLAKAAHWLMDSLMLGVGVGFDTHRATFLLHAPDATRTKTIVIPDSREGWVDSVAQLIESYEDPGSPQVRFNYSKIRPYGSPIRGFGGTASGPKPLIELHERIRTALNAHVLGQYSKTRLITDVMNAIGACVVAGNVRRSAEIALGSIRDNEFINLKNYDLAEGNPERGKFGWLSNNSVVLSDPSDFELLPSLGERIADNGEPGIINLMNFKYGRYGELLKDTAIGINPCGEIPLASYELCNLVEVFPTRCAHESQILTALELATFYASTIALLPSHREETNEIVEANRRIGVSVSGIADWIDSTSHSYVYGMLNRGYTTVWNTNRELAFDAGVEPSIRLTTVKPSGTISLLAGVSPGMHHPEAGVIVRRVRFAAEHAVVKPLVEAGIPAEPDVNDPNTLVLEFPLHFGQGKTRSVKEVPIAEQAGIVSALSKFWADNAVSNTLKFQPEEAAIVPEILSTYGPFVKSISMLRDKGGIFPQMPIEAISEEEFEKRCASVREVEWGGVVGGDGYLANAYCDGDSCELPL